MTALDYAQYRNWKIWDDASFGQCSADAAIYYSQELRRSGIGSLQDRRVLEVGFGSGQFAGSCHSSGADYIGICAIGSSMVRQLAAQAGFNVDGIREPTFPLRGMGAMKWLRRASVVACRRLVYSLIAQAFMGSGRPVLTPNLVFVLVKP